MSSSGGTVSLPKFKALSFAGGPPIWSNSADRLLREAKESKFLPSLEIANSRELEWRLGKNASTVLQLTRKFSRGFGYWAWKPALMLAALEHLPPHFDGVAWLDVGNSLNFGNSAAKSRWLSYEDEARKDGYKFFRLGGNNSHRLWTKREALACFPATNLDINLFTASAFFVSRNQAGHELLARWCQLALFEDGSLLNDSMDPAIQDPSFIDHRHDQSLLSLVLESIGYPGVLDETYFAPGWKAKGLDYPIWTSRLRSGFSQPSEAFVPKVLRRLEREYVNRFREFDSKSRGFDTHNG